MVRDDTIEGQTTVYTTQIKNDIYYQHRKIIKSKIGRNCSYEKMKHIWIVTYSIMASVKFPNG